MECIAPESWQGKMRMGSSIVRGVYTIAFSNGMSQRNAKKIYCESEKETVI